MQNQNHAVPASQSRHENSSAEQRQALLVRLWLELDAAYGNLFDDGGGVGQPKFNIWLDALGAITIEQLRQGIFALRRRKDKFPPTLAEFRSICQDAASQAATQADRDFQEQEQLRALERQEECRQKSEKRAARLLAGKESKGRNRIVRRGTIYVHQVRRNGCWYDQPPRGIQGVTARGLLGDEFDLIDPSIARDENDQPVEVAA